MQWRVVVELSGAVDVIQVHEVHSGGSTVAGCSAAMLGLTLQRPKRSLAACSAISFRRKRRSTVRPGDAARGVAHTGR